MLSSIAADEETTSNTSQTFWHRLPTFQVDLRCTLHRVSTSSCRGHVDELVTEPFLLLHRKHGTGCRWSWNCCDQRTRFVVIWKHFCFILSTYTRIQIDFVMRPRCSSKRRNTSASVTAVVAVFSNELTDRTTTSYCELWLSAFSTVGHIIHSSIVHFYLMPTVIGSDVTGMGYVWVPSIRVG